jgi:hypothetical protein
MRYGESKVCKHGAAETLYLSIPSKMATDSTCPIKEGDTVELQIVEDFISIRKSAGGQRR